MKIFDSLLLLEIAIAPIILISLLFITAPYGRHTKKNWGFQIDTRYGWILMELPAVLTILFIFVLHWKNLHISNFIFLGIWQIHYLYRTFYFPFKLKGRKKSFPISIVLFAVLFNLLNGYLNGEFLFNIRPQIDYSFVSSYHFWIGLIIFFSGFVIHLISDHVIINLREYSDQEYSIPNGFMFKYISSPNYFGEWIQWIGWAILTWSITGMAFAVFTFCNLLPRAISNDKWYKQKFVDYPEDRKIFIPKIY